MIRSAVLTVSQWRFDAEGRPRVWVWSLKPHGLFRTTFETVRLDDLGWPRGLPDGGRHGFTPEVNRCHVACTALCSEK